MATNRDLLKEAIADAKAVKEMAIANAKSALEEAFAPRIKEMFSAKLNEMDLEEEYELEEMYGMSNEEKMEEMKDETMEEAGFGKSMTDSDEGFSSGMGEKALDEELNLEELLAELEEEEVEGPLNEAEEEEETEEVESEKEVEEEGEPLDLKDMTDEDLKEMVEEVVDEMIKSGELEAGESYEGEATVEETVETVEEEESEEEEVDLAELLREIEEETNEEIVNESVADIIGQLQAIDPAIMGDVLKAALVGLPIAGFGTMFAKSWREAKKAEKEKLKTSAEKAGATKELEKAIDGETTNSSPELEEAYSTIESLRSDLNEVNLLNAKLLYTNKIFKAKNLNESQKVKVLSSFDKANTVGEVKLVFETLNEGLKVKNTIKENRGSASKSTIVPTTKKPIVESNDAFARMQQLAFYKSEQ